MNFIQVKPAKTSALHLETPHRIYRSINNRKLKKMLKR